jgi:hypothetical protein
MRSGLLTVGIILLVLGAIFYFVPRPATATDTSSVDTTKYQTMDNGSSGNAFDYYYNSDSTTNSMGNGSNNTRNTTGDNTFVGTTGTTTDRTTTSTIDTTTSTVANTAVSTTSSGTEVISIFMDCQGRIFPYNGNTVPAGADTSCGTAPNFDNGRTVAETYGNNSGTVDNTGTTTTAYNSNGSNGSDTTTVSDTGSYGSSGTMGTTTDSTTGSNGDNGSANTGSTSGTSDTTTTSSGSGVYNQGNDQTTVDQTSGDNYTNDTTNASATASSLSTFGGGALRTLALIAMILGAILTVLGLILPSPAEDRRARASGASGRKVEYERHTEKRRE